MSTTLQPASHAAQSCLYREWSEPDYPFVQVEVHSQRDGTVSEAEWLVAPGETAGLFCVGLTRPSGKIVEISNGNGGHVTAAEIRLVGEGLLVLAAQIEANHARLDADARAIKELVAHVRSGRPELVAIG